MYKNYKLVKSQLLKDIDCNGILLEHIKTGARVLLLESSDENKTFCIGFRTPPKDSTGVPHIIEHSVLCGSKKYPVKEPFVELMKSSLNTFLNAMTFPDKTLYPVSSCNDQDFANLMDVYLDAVFYPSIHTKKEIFQQEGWHYELESLEGELIYNGVVYNEMKGAFSSPESVLERETFNALFPDTTYGVESGGHPDNIPDLTYEDFKEFHSRYYHPSNSYIILYGNCNMEERLEYLDKEYLSKFEKLVIDSTIKEQTPFTKTKELVMEYPVTKEQGTENKTYMSYGVALPKDLSIVDSYGIEIVIKVLVGAAGAPLERALLDAGIGTYITGTYESSILQPVLDFTTKDTKPEEKDHFVEVIEETLRKLVKEGLNKKALEAAINKYEFKLREADFGGMSKGLIYGMNSFTKWLYDDEDVFSWCEFDKIFGFLKEQIQTNYFESLIEKYILNNNHKAVLVINPNDNLQEQKEKALKEKLAKYKASLSKEEQLQIIEDTKHLKAYQATDDTKEDLATIPLLKKEDLSYDVVPLSNNEYEVNGVKVLHHDFNTNGIGYLRLLFNLKNIPSNLLPYLGIFVSVIGSLDTDKHTYETLDQDIDINTGGINTSFYSRKINLEDYYIGMNFSASAIYDKLSYAVELINEIIHTTKYDMNKRMLECLQVEMAKMQNKCVGAGHAISMVRASSYSEVLSYYGDLTGGIRYLEIVSNILKDYQNEYPKLVEALQKLNEHIFTKENLLVSFTGSIEGFNQVKESLETLIDQLFKDVKVSNSFVFEPNQLQEGFKAPVDVQYVALTGNYARAGLKYTGALNVFQNAVSTDYLWKQMRVLGGAYGCMCGFSKTGESYFVSYRDPHLTRTLDEYRKVLNYIDEFNATSEEMTKYIIGAVGSYDTPLSPSSKGARSLGAYITKTSIEDYKKEKREIIDATLEDIKAIRPIIEAILNQNNICVVGNEKKIEETEGIFKSKEMLLK